MVGWKAGSGGLRAVLAVALAVLVAACGGSRSASGNDVAVSGSGPAGELAPGATAVFTMVVANQGSNNAQDVRLVNQLGSFLVLAGISCDAAGGAVCPVAPGPVMTIASLPAGGSLTFRVSATVNAVASGMATNTMSATAPEDIGRVNNSATATASVVVAVASLGVVLEAPATAHADAPAVFRLTVANPSGGTATSNVVIDWALTAPFALDGISYTCTASAGAECPAAQAPAAGLRFTLPTLGVARTLVFTFTVPMPADGRGAMRASASVSATGDADVSNNTASATTQAVDARNGVYQVYAADGRAYELTIDFDARQYTMAGNGRTDVRSFTVEAGGDAVVTGNERLRTAQDLVVGAHGFAAGVVPYVAARRFVGSANGLAGVFNLMARSVAADGSAPVTRVATARVSGNVLYVCQDDFEVVQAQFCSVGAQRAYLLGFSGDTFTASDAASGTAFNFRIARSGAAEVLLSVGISLYGDVAQRQLVLGTAESAGLVDSATRGAGVYPDGASEWLAITLTRSTYVAEGSRIEDLAGLFRPDTVDALAPLSMLQGAPGPTLGGAPIWVMQAYPLVVVVGATRSETDQANASGLFQIALP